MDPTSYLAVESDDLAVAQVRTPSSALGFRFQALGLVQALGLGNLKPKALGLGNLKPNACVRLQA
jgi:hypothetical protein